VREGSGGSVGVDLDAFLRAKLSCAREREKNDDGRKCSEVRAVHARLLCGRHEEGALRERSFKRKILQT
jgi:hypothetical protein